MECPICRHNAVYHLDGCLADDCECERMDVGLYQDRIDELETQLAALSWARWIPVTERLPEKDGWYFVTWRVTRGHYLSGEARYHPAYGWIFPAYGDDKDNTPNPEIIAWMPLPPAYQPEQEQGANDE